MVLPQLRNSNRRRSRHSEPRPTVELMAAININELRRAIPRYPNTINEPDVSFKYPNLAYLRLSASWLEITDYHDRVQRFRIVWIRTGLGRHRAILVCASCHCGAIRLFARYGTYACRHCHKAVYASQKHDQNGRKRLAACKLRLKLGGLPDINDIFPNKAKWKHRKRYQQLRNTAQALEAKAKRTRFRKHINTSIFAYHAA